MFKGIIIKLEKKFVVVKNEQAEIDRIKRLKSFNLGDTIEYTKRDFYRGFSLISYARLLTILPILITIVGASVYFMVSSENRIYSTITVDVNPSVELGINRNGDVVYALNKETGETLFERSSDEDIPTNDFLFSFENDLKEAGIIRDDDVLVIAIYLNIETDDNTGIELLSKYIEETKHSSVVIYSNDDLYDQARDGNVSMGRIVLENMLVENDEKIDDDNDFIRNALEVLIVVDAPLVEINPSSYDMKAIDKLEDVLDDSDDHNNDTDEDNSASNEIVSQSNEVTDQNTSGNIADDSTTGDDTDSSDNNDNDENTEASDNSENDENKETDDNQKDTNDTSDESGDVDEQDQTSDDETNEADSESTDADSDGTEVNDDETSTEEQTDSFDDKEEKTSPKYDYDELNTLQTKLKTYVYYETEIQSILEKAETVIGTNEDPNDIVLEMNELITLIENYITVRTRLVKLIEAINKYDVESAKEFVSRASDAVNKEAHSLNKLVIEGDELLKKLETAVVDEYKQLLSELLGRISSSSYYTSEIGALNERFESATEYEALYKDGQALEVKINSYSNSVSSINDIKNKLSNYQNNDDVSQWMKAVDSAIDTTSDLSSLITQGNELISKYTSSTNDDTTDTTSSYEEDVATLKALITFMEQNSGKDDERRTFITNATNDIESGVDLKARIEEGNKLKDEINQYNSEVSTLKNIIEQLSDPAYKKEEAKKFVDEANTLLSDSTALLSSKITEGNNLINAINEYGNQVSTYQEIKSKLLTYSYYQTEIASYIESTEANITNERDLSGDISTGYNLISTIDNYINDRTTLIGIMNEIDEKGMSPSYVSYAKNALETENHDLEGIILEGKAILEDSTS